MRGAHTEGKPCVWVEPNISRDEIEIREDDLSPECATYICSAGQLRQLIFLLEDAARILEWDITTKEQS